MKKWKTFTAPLQGLSLHFKLVETRNNNLQNFSSARYAFTIEATQKWQCLSQQHKQNIQLDN